MVACLVSGLISTLALSVLAYAAGRSLRLLHGISSPFFLASTLCLAAVLLLSLAGGIQWFDLLPVPDVLLWSSAIAPFLCFTAALATFNSGLRSFSQSLVALSYLSV